MSLSCIAKPLHSQMWIQKITGCYSGFSCESETNDFIATLKQNGYTVEETDNHDVFWDVVGTHYVSWSSK